MTARRGLRLTVTALVLATSCVGSSDPPPPPEVVRRHPFEATSISFTDRDHGWAFHGSCDQYALCNDLWATADGGATWREVPAPTGRRKGGPPLTDPATGAVHSVVFADTRHGWLADPGLFVTHDGGREWKEERHDGAVFDLAARDGWAWALERPPCPGDTWPCRRQVAQVLRGPVSGSLEPLDEQPERVKWANQLVVVSDRRAYLVVGDLAPTEILATADGGATWRREEAPCHRDTVRLHVLAPSRLWLTCTVSHLGTRHFQSLDDGRQWEPAPFPETGDDFSGPFPLDETRILYDKGDSKGIRVSASWGRTDQVVLPTPRGAVGRGLVREFHQADADHLWLLTIPVWPPDPEADPSFIFRPGRSLLRSDDGGVSWIVTQVK